MTIGRDPPPQLFDDAEVGADDSYFTAPYGMFARQKIKAMVRRKLILAKRAIEEDQFQPASLDLRLGKEAFRVRASFLPGRGRTVMEQLDSLNPERVSLAGDGAVLEKGIVYIAPLAERLELPPSLSGAANPKSSTGRLDIFTRLIVDRSEAFDDVPLGYDGPLYAEISPRSFSVRVREGSKLNQIRFRNRNSKHKGLVDFALTDEDIKARHAQIALVDGALDLRDGLILRVGLGGSPGQIVGYRAQKNGDVIDVDRPGAYAAEEFWEPIRARADGRLVLDPEQFYILASREKMQIPADLAAEMAPIDPAIGEFRVHYAGFFDPGFGHGPDGRPSARAVLEVRSRDVPFLLEDGQPVGRLVYEKLADKADELYGATAVSNYQGQGLKLSKHFRAFGAA
ncbi:2'-deoxycytidine 5'-triphosphate deaminase [Methylocapsa sp. S129]|uniref:2'-deoxycytidine 5'-triphosphate deaminase n=1 Tax=Methylocapsa sp. S129 TaxID=1641869 RepID=UPI00210FDFCA|nr:2'-deoxycytidine 5'-triphosphate deaminase [Methylocapsa sp. S129]